MSDPSDMSATRGAVAASIARTFAVWLFVAAIALEAPLFLGPRPGGFVPSSFTTHSLMLALSIALAALLTKGRLALYGFTIGSYRFHPRVLLWALPTSVLSVMEYVGSRMHPGVPNDPFPQSKLATVLFIWIYASVCEEVFMRGLFQSMLAPLRGSRLRIGSLSAPVLASGLVFGAMHVVLWRFMGVRALVPMILGVGLGTVAARYREKTGSLLPGILIHALFNIGGAVPFWVLRAILR